MSISPMQLLGRSSDYEVVPPDEMYNSVEYL